MNTCHKLSKRCLLVILDGFGINKADLKNAIKHASTPYIDMLFKSYPFTTIEAGGIKVGLPKGVCGNSEVGHINLGAGRPVRQDLVRINESIEENTLPKMPELIKLIEHAKRNGNRVHLMGLLSDGGVHSHINHIKNIISILAKENIKLFFHAFMDGRDTAPNIGLKYIQDLQSQPGVTFASMQGRSIGMDRDRRWEKIKLAYDTFTGAAKITNLTPEQWLEKEYEKERFDEFVSPVLFNSDYKMRDNDSLFFLNFRPDRAIELSLAFNDDNFNEFPVKFRPSRYLCMTPYIPDEVTLPILFDKEKVNGTLGQHLSAKGFKQYKIAETEKYAHVTYFFNGGEKNPLDGEDHILIPSPKEVETYDLKPEMSAHTITEKLITAIKSHSHDFYLVNYANSDMVGHTGKFDAAVKAIQTLDSCMKELIDICLKEELTVLLTADHGNSDQMEYPNGVPHTSHTGAPVPFCLIHPALKNIQLDLNETSAALMNVSPTVLYVMGIEQPSSFEGKSIFK
ncbi:MAG: 2,3-bisphosphoglycerate-independent phosphoglycerate mutase [Bacteriovoracaceae bacterium]|nr:2,3-bisphosphoglycerate-independent phosphoglycerate mutase [Bacteriovoracaceae bacterium]